MTFKFSLLLLLTTVACSSGPTGPTTISKPPSPFSYAINLPFSPLVSSLNASYPKGVKLSPLEAQERWNFTSAYGGTPNVYFGEVAPCGQNFLNTAIVIAPVKVASQATFDAIDWPSSHLPAGRYEWVGYFTLAIPALPGFYGPCSHF